MQVPDMEVPDTEVPDTKVNVRIFDTGYCTASQHHIVRGTAKRPIECHCLVALIEHPTHGLILFDTGYAPRMQEAMSRFPYSIYGWMIPSITPEELALATQLEELGVKPSDVKTVIMSHFHGDHTAGLKDFPNAKIVCTGDAFDHYRTRRGFAAVRKAYLPQLLPDDAADRVERIDEFNEAELPGIGPTHDLFGDGTILLFPLPGHARGQIGALVSATDGKYLLAADGCWQRESLRLRAGPHWISYVFIDNSRQMLATLEKLAEFHRVQPEVIVVPTHCPEAYEEFVESRQRAKSQL